MREFEYKPRGVCARNIHIELDDQNAVHNVSFEGGCNGNLKAIGKLIEGMPADKVISILSGNTCGARSTSCADQLSRALADAVKQQ